MAWTWPLMLHGSASVVVLWRVLARTGRARASRGSSDSDGCGWMAGIRPWMLHRSASVVVLWSLVVVNSGGSGKMAWSWPLELHGSAPIVVLWRALVVVVWSVGPVVVVWSAGLVCREAERSASLVVVRCVWVPRTRPARRATS